MSTVLAFDIYGTLIDTHGVITELTRHVGDRAGQFSRVWRDKQLEYTWRKGLMRRYENFAVCTRQALDYTDSYLQTELDGATKDSLMQIYRVLPAFDDVAGSLESLAREDMRLYAFSNGLADAVEGLLEHAGIDHLFDGVISVDPLQTFKPDPVVYHHVTEITETEPSQCWLVSSNCFDVIGAISAGLNAAWLRRSKEVVFDPWGVQPSVEIDSLSELVSRINR
jgi:2-haloacid dehalogenase